MRRAIAERTGAQRATAAQRPKESGAFATTRALLAVANQVAGAESPHEIARIVTEIVQKTFGGDVSAIQLRRPDGSFYLAHAAGEMSDEQREILRTRRFSHRTHSILEREQRVIAIDDVHTSGLADPKYLALIPRRSTMLVPFTRGDQLLGYWGIHYIHHTHHWRPSEIALAEGIGRQTAMALDNLRLREAERAKAERLEAIHAVTSDILARRELGQVLDAVVEHALRLTGREQGGVFLWDEAADGLRAVASRGREPELLGRVRRGPSLSMAVFRADRSLVVNDYPAYAEADPQVLGAGVQTAVCVPLRAAQGPIGVLTVSDRVAGRTFGEADLHVLELLAGHAALAIEKARLLQREREMAKLEGAIETARGLAHELNQPLGIIAGQAEVLGDMTDPATPLRDVRECLVDMQAAVARLSHKVLQLQGIVRIETSELAGVGRYIDLDRSAVPPDPT